VFFRNFTLSAQPGRLNADGGVLVASDESTLSVPVTGPLEGTTLTDRSLLRLFKPLLTKAGLRQIRFHDLHSFGSLLIQSGAWLAYVRDQMGHSSLQITVDIYGT